MENAEQIPKQYNLIDMHKDLKRIENRVQILVSRLVYLNKGPTTAEKADGSSPNQDVDFHKSKMGNCINNIERLVTKCHKELDYLTEGEPSNKVVPMRVEKSSDSL